jgi:outer membrane protein
MIKVFKLAILLIFFLNNYSYSQEKIVFIDINYVFVNSNAGKDLNLQIKNKNKQLKKEVDDYKKNILLEKNKLISQKNVLSNDEYTKKINELENKIKNINLTVSKKNQDFALFKQLIEKEFSKKLNLIIEEYSVKNSISIILKKQDLLMAKNELDITNDIFDLFNKKINKIDIN